VAAAVERQKQVTDHRHPLYGHQQHPSRFRSRKSFLKTTEIHSVTPEVLRLQLWRQEAQQPPVPLREELPAGCHLPYPHGPKKEDPK
jgi:hypothetical protein